MTTILGEQALAEWIVSGEVVALTGAGVSTASGIPDYRGPNGAFTRGHKPMTYQQFLRDPQGRTRYWARGHVGWTRFAQAAPNQAHHALASLEAQGLVSGVITQNVDGLHQAAGSRSVIDLHGRLDRVVCLECGSVEARTSVHQRLTAANPQLTVQSESINPDGDVDLPEHVLDGFQMVACLDCGGDIKPDVVYFGESVPVDRVQQAYQLVDQARMVLVAGSSLTVYSGRRFVIHAYKAGTPVVIINAGETRCDDLASLRIDRDVCEVLTSLIPADR